MTDPTLYRDDSRVRHILRAIERIIEVGADMSRDQLRQLAEREQIFRTGRSRKMKLFKCVWST